MQRVFLDESERGVLLELIASRPNASHAQLAAIFAARTGRKISRQYVGKRRSAGGYKTEAGGYTLDDRGREVLANLVIEANGESPLAEIAGQFEAISGRTISKQAVWRLAVQKLRFPKVGKGGRPSQRTADLAMRIEAASSLKISGSKVDRSTRVGRSGRVSSYRQEESA